MRRSILSRCARLIGEGLIVILFLVLCVGALEMILITVVVIVVLFGLGPFIDWAGNRTIKK